MERSALFRVEYAKTDAGEPPFIDLATEDEAVEACDDFIRRGFTHVWLLRWVVRVDTGGADWVCTWWSNDAWPEDPGALRPSEGWARKGRSWTALTTYVPVP